MTVHLKVIVEQSESRCGCACSYYKTEENKGMEESKGTEEKDSVPGWQQNLRMVDELVQVLKDRYEDRLDISVVNPRSIRAFWDNIRYKVRPFVPVWVLDREKFCEGVPDLADLQNAIDSRMKTDRK